MESIIYEHSKAEQQNGYGENIAFSTFDTKREAVESAIRDMYDEIKDYSYENPSYVPPGEQVGHFTQV